MITATRENSHSYWPRNKIALGIMSDRQKLAAALKDLEEIKFPMETISIIPRSYRDRKQIIEIKSNLIASLLQGIINNNHTEEFRRNWTEVLDLQQKESEYYLNRVRSGHYLVKIVGTKGEVLAAKAIFNVYDIEEWQVCHKSPIKAPLLEGFCNYLNLRSSNK